MRNFTSDPKGIPTHHQDMKLYVYANPEDACAARRWP
jgi:hypothetical protein